MIEDIFRRRSRSRTVGDALRHWQQPRNLCVLIGPTDAGKGAFIRILRSVFGEDNVASETLHDLTASEIRKYSESIKRRLDKYGLLDPPEERMAGLEAGDSVSSDHMTITFVGESEDARSEHPCPRSGRLARRSPANARTPPVRPLIPARSHMCVPTPPHVRSCICVLV